VLELSEGVALSQAFVWGVDAINSEGGGLPETIRLDSIVSPAFLSSSDTMWSGVGWMGGGGMGRPFELM